MKIRAIWLEQAEPEGPATSRATDLRVIVCNGGDERAFGIAFTADVRLVVAGYAQVSASNPRREFAVARYKLNGHLDSSFSNDGRVTTRVSPKTEDDKGFDVVVSPDGEITVAGEAEPTVGGSKFALVRYLENGRLDRSFGKEGRVVTRFPGGLSPAQDGATTIAAAGRGRVVVAGDSNQHTGRDFALARYLRDGSLDDSFDDDGRVTTDFLGGSDAANGVLVEPQDGRIVAAGRASEPSSTNDGYAIARYLRNGGPDGSFAGPAGTMLYSFDNAPGEAINAIEIQANGKILAAGDGPPGDFALLRFTSGGAIDLNFSPPDDSGIEYTDFLASDTDSAKDLALQPGTGGKIVVAGSTDDTLFNRGLDIALARYYGG